MRVLVIAGALALLTACGPQASKTSETPASTACADGGVRLAGTGLCQADARALLPRDPDVRTPELEGCAWVVNETMLPENEALLYNAAVCKGVLTKLAFAGGAHSAEISYDVSARFGDAAKGRTVLRLHGVDPDPQGALKGAIAEAPGATAAGCAIRTAGYEGLPKDALIIAPAKSAAGEACGPTGVTQGKMRYWRVRQGFAWFFDLGGEDPDFDAGNMTIVTKGADGVWKAKP